jgi:uncharacterized protein
LLKSLSNSLPLHIMFRNLSAKPFGIQLLSFVFIWMLAAIISVVVTYLALIGSGFSLEQYQQVTNYNSMQWVNATIRIQIASTITMFGLPAIAFAYMAFPKAKKYLGLIKFPKFIHIVLAILALIVSFGIVAYLAQINHALPMPTYFVNMESKAASMTKALLDFNSIQQLILTILYIGLLPALVEELFFRGCLQNILLQHFPKSKAWKAILITAVIFGLLHGQMQTLLPRVFLGILLGLLYYYSGSLWLSIIAHFFNNGIQVVFNFLFKQKKLTIDISENPTVTIWVALASFTLCIIIVYAIYNRKENYICHVANIKGITNE